MKRIVFGLTLLTIAVLIALVTPDHKKGVSTISIKHNTTSVEKCPAGFVLVPGNPLYKTKDFCVMKYDAKCADMSNPTVGLAPAAGATCSGLSVDGGYAGVYKNNLSTCTCTSNNHRQVVSTASGFPITYIALSDNTSNNAKAYCQSYGWHVITNNEWMTIARNVEKVSMNWCSPDGSGCGNTPGTKGKILASGHGDNANEPKASAGGTGSLIATDDAHPCFGTTTDGSNTCGGKSSQKRTLMLTNGNILWDFAGNVWQWVDAQVQRNQEPESASNGLVDRGWLKSDFAPGSLPSVITNNGQVDVLGYDAIRPSNPTWNANQGVGRIYHYSDPNDTSTLLYGIIRGGNWRHFDDDGAFTMHLSPPVYTEGIDDVGFRCVAPISK